MAYYKLIRKPADGAWVRGQICEVFHYFNNRTGEYRERLFPLCETIENKEYLIPALTYHVAVNRSPKFKRLLPILEQVPGRTGIRIHRGSHPKHSRGCILVSQLWEQLLTTRFLREQSNHDECRMEICNYTNLNIK